MEINIQNPPLWKWKGLKLTSNSSAADFIDENVPRKEEFILGPGAGAGVGCGVGVGLGLVAGAGFGGSTWNQARITFGLGVGCGVGIGFGFGCDQSSLQAMASGAGQPATFFLFFINLVLFLIITIIASWAVNHGIDDTHQQASVLSIPARIFPIYYPFGNMATGYVVILSLLAGVLGLATSLTGIYNVAQWNASNLYAASASSLLSWTLTLLAMGFACKEIEIGWTGNTLRVLETILIVVTGTQLFGMIAIHAGIEEVSRYGGGGRV